MRNTRQVVESGRFALLAVAVILADWPRPAFPADWLELIGLSSASGTTPVIVVEVRYPGASAQVVADTIAAPIEQQVNGVEKMRYMRSRCTNQGTYALQVVFDKKADLDMAQVLVQNRVTLALPMLPETVQNRGVTVRKLWPRPLAIVLLRSPDGSRDVRALSREATVNVRDDLLRLPGTGQIRCLGQNDFGLRILLKPKELADRKLTVCDVMGAIREQNAKPAAVPGARLADTVTGLGRLADPGQYGRIILRTDAAGRVVMLKDVAQIDFGPDSEMVATLGGKPVVAQAVYLLPGARPQKIIADIEARLAEIRPRLSKGVAIDASFDFVTGVSNKSGGGDFVLIDVNLLGGEAHDLLQKTVQRCQSLLGGVAGVQDVLALPESPWVVLAGPPCLVVRLMRAEKRPIEREKIVAGIRSRLAEVKGARLRVHDLPRFGDPAGADYPVDMAVCGPDADKLRELTARLATCLPKSRKLTDVWADSELKSSPQLYVDIDRAMARRRGVATSDIFDTLAALGGAGGDDANGLGSSWQVKIDVGDKLPPDVATLLVRSGSGELVPLSTVASLRMVAGRGIVDRFNLQPMVEVSANLAAGVSLADVRADGETLFAQIRKEFGLNEGYRLSWLGQ